jgi:hypothetical protein
MAKSNYEFVKEWRKRNPEKYAAQSKRYQKKYPEKGRAASMRWLERNREKARVLNRVGVAKYKAKKEAERVEIAGRPRPSICDLCRGNHHLGIVFDHCHESGNFRGWICDRCNKVLGLVADNALLLRKMARYLDRSNGKANRQKEECPSVECFRWAS